MRVPIPYLAESGVTFVLGHPQLIRRGTLAGRRGARGSAGSRETWSGGPRNVPRNAYVPPSATPGSGSRRGSGDDLRGVPPGRPGRRPEAGGHGARADVGEEVRGAARGADLG